MFGAIGLVVFLGCGGLASIQNRDAQDQVDNLNDRVVQADTRKLRPTTKPESPAAVKAPAPKKSIEIEEPKKSVTVSPVKSPDTAPKSVASVPLAPQKTEAEIHHEIYGNRKRGSASQT